MRKRFLGTIAALAAGAGGAWGQPPAALPAPPAGVPAVGAAPALPPTAPTPFGGFPSNAIPGNAGFAPAPTIMPPMNVGPPNDPLGLGPVGGFGPPPGPMYPMPGPYGAAQFQPAPRTPGGGAGGGAGGDLGYCTAPHWWVIGEYLLWFNKGQNIRYPLLTTSAPSDAGMIGAASTTILVGERDLGYNAFNGFRLTAGFFGDADRRFGFETSGFMTERRSNIQEFGGLGNPGGTPVPTLSGIPTLARPFIDFSTGAPSTIVLSGPDFGPARAVVGTNSQTYGVEADGVWNLYRSGPGSRYAWSVDFLAGYRFLQLKEELYVSSFTQLIGQLAIPVFTVGPFGIITQTGVNVGPGFTSFGGVNVISPQAVIDIRDRFKTINRFNGVVFGLRGESRYGMFTTNWFTKVAVGNMHERLEIFGGGAFFDPSGASGSTFPPFFVNNVPQIQPGGIGATYGGVLANPANIGTFVQDRFSVIPEFGGSVGIALTKGLTGFIGVNFLYIPDVIRPGSQASPIVNSAAIPFSSTFGAPGSPRGPRIIFDQDDYWLGGVNVGLMVRY